MMDRDYILFYILGILFLIALLIWKDIEPLNYILGILTALTIHLNFLIAQNRSEVQDNGNHI